MPCAPLPCSCFLTTEALCGQLDQMRRLQDLPEDCQPHDFPRPAKGSLRSVRTWGQGQGKGGAGGSVAWMPCVCK